MYSYILQNGNLEYMPTGVSLLLGTYIICRMEQFIRGPGANKTDINELISFENRINLLNGIGILLQFVRILTPSDIGDNYIIVLSSLLMQFFIFLSTCHRAFGSLMIAGVR